MTSHARLPTRPVPSLWAQGAMQLHAVHAGACVHVCQRSGSPGRLEQLRNCL